jgi:malate dehydrogenase (oxaloacetate-decarboxylating)
VRDIILVDSKGALAKSRTDLNDSKKEILALTNPRDISGHLQEVLIGADCFIGLSAPGILDSDDIVTMAPDPIVFALANPTPEIMPDLAKAGGAAVVATGRSDFPNQLNNALAFPGIFKGLLNKRIRQVTTAMLTRAAEGLASKVAEPTTERIIPSIFEEGVAETVAAAIE